MLLSSRSGANHGASQRLHQSATERQSRSWMSFYLERVQALLQDAHLRSSIALPHPHHCSADTARLKGTLRCSTHTTYQAYLRRITGAEGLRASQHLLFGSGGIIESVDLYRRGCDNRPPSAASSSSSSAAAARDGSRLQVRLID